MNVITPLFGRGNLNVDREPDLFERENYSRQMDNAQRAQACSEYLRGARASLDFTVAPESVEMAAAAPYERRARGLAY